MPLKSHLGKLQKTHIDGFSPIPPKPPPLPHINVDYVFYTVPIMSYIMKFLGKGKNNHYRRLFCSRQEEKDTKRIHSMAKNLLGWNRDLGPRNFLHQRRIVRSPITTLGQYFMATNCFANKWRISQIHPLHKDLDWMDLASFCPVSMLSAVSKTRRYGGLQPPTSSSCGGLVAFGHLEGPSEGWWPSATWRALRALFSFRCLEGLLPIIFI